MNKFEAFVERDDVSTIAALGMTPREKFIDTAIMCALGLGAWWLLLSAVAARLSEVA